MHTPRRRRVLLLLVLLLVALQVIEIWIFGIMYSLLLMVGVIHGAQVGTLLDYVYFAAVTFSMLGLGDLVPSGTIWFMVGTESLVGFVLISWPAASTCLEVERFWGSPHHWTPVTERGSLASNGGSIRMEILDGLVIPRRFRGPPESGNGGYVAGRLASFAATNVRVRLLQPPPLEVALDVARLPDGTLLLRHGEVVVADARPYELQLEIPRPPDYLQAMEASLSYAGLRYHPYPGCFVCGPGRARGDGLCLFAGPVAGRALVAAPWTPDDSVAVDGKVLPEHMFAALDCPGAFALGPLTPGIMLGTLSAHIDRRARAGKPHVVIGWRIGRAGRKCRVGTAIFDEDGDLCGRAEGIWILPREEAG